MTHVWLAEIEEADDEGHLIYTGRFDCEFEESGRRESADGLPFGEALAWARARSDRVWIDAQGTRFSAGAKPDRELPRLSPAVAERLERGSRRPSGDEWIDRDQNAPPAAASRLARTRPHVIWTHARGRHHPPRGEADRSRAGGT